MIKQGLWCVVAVGLSFSVFAETVDDVELTCDTEWTIAKGETKHVEYLRVNTPVTLTVKGGGTLELAVVDAPDLAIRMVEGKLKTVRPETMSAPALDAGDWAYHLDASAKSTIVDGGDQRDGFPTVAEWNDVDGNMHPHYPTTKFCAKVTSANVPKPYYRENFQNGLPVVDFGTFCNPNAVGSSSDKCFLAFCGNVDRYTVTNHVEVFIAWQDHPDARTYTPVEGKTSYNGPQMAMGATAFYRGINVGDTGFKLFANSNYSLAKGDMWLDGRPVKYTEVPDSGWHVFHDRAVNGGNESNSGCLSMCGWSVYGGNRVGEVWAFSKPLDVELSARIRTYLQAKWLGPRVGTVELNAAATMENAASFRGSVVRVNLSGSVWDDCDFVFDGANDRNGDGLFQTGELVDLRHAADTNRWTHGIYRTDSKADDKVLIRTGDVVPVTSSTDGTLFRNQRYVSVYQRETTNETGTVTLSPMCLRFPENNGPSKNAASGTNDVYTILARFRIGRYCGRDAWTLLHANSWLSGETGGGPLVRVCPTNILEPNGDGTVTTNYWDVTEGRFTVNMGTATVFSGTSFVAVTNGCWYEMAFVANRDQVLAGLAKMNDVMAFKSWKRTSSQKFTLAPKAVPIKLFSESTGTASTTLKAIGSKNGEGDLAFLAMWSRALSTNEIRAAFSRAGNAVMGVGVPGLSRAIFAGEESFAGEKTFETDAVDWSDMPRSLAAGAKLNLKFRVPNWRDDQPQFLRIGTTADSAAGTFTATLGGVSQPVSLVPGGVASAYFPRECFPTNVELTLTLERTDAGAGAVEFDFAEFTGSWRLGYLDNDSDGSAETLGYPEFHLTDRNGRDWNQAATTARTNATGAAVSNTGKKSVMKFVLPADIGPENCSGRFSMAVRSSSVGSGNGAYLPVAFKVNGVKYGKFHIGTGPADSEKLNVTVGGLPKPVTVTLPVGSLRSGENVVEFSIEGVYGAHGWASLDYAQFEIRSPSGMLILVR